jgi:hypothetical protein
MYLAGAFVGMAMGSVGCSQPTSHLSPVEIGGRRYLAENAAVWTKVQQTIVDADFEDVGLEEAVTSLGDRYDVNILVNWDALEMAAIERDAPVNIRLKQVSLAVVLDAILGQVGAGECELGYEAMRGVLTVSSREDLSLYHSTRAYHVGRLLAKEHSLLRYGKLQGLGFCNWSPPEYSMADIARFDGPDALLMLIVNVIDPDSWQINGGKVGTIWAYGDVLVVSHVRSAHLEIEKLLAFLRTAHGLN